MDARLVKLGDESSVPGIHYGRVRLQSAELTALCTPAFCVSLLSIDQVCTAEYISIVRKGMCEISSDLWQETQRPLLS